MSIFTSTEDNACSESRGMHKRGSAWVMSFKMDDGIQRWAGWVDDIALSVNVMQSWLEVATTEILAPRDIR